jgi:hypothetical protein
VVMLPVETDTVIQDLDTLEEYEKWAVSGER